MSGRFSSLKTGLALGGGAARGMVHLGVLQELEKANIPINYIAGTSVGSAIGGLYALEPDAQMVTRKFLKFLHGEDFKMAKMDFLSSAEKDNASIEGVWNNLSRKFRRSVFYGISLANISFLPEEMLKKNLEGLIPDADFSDCKIPFSCGATELRSKKVVYFDKGPMRPAILASSSIPGLFPPVITEESIFIDGSWAEQNPVRRVREMGADFVIAVDIMLDDQREPDLSNSFDVLISGGVVTRGVLAKLQLKDADVVISPDLKDIHWADFSRAPYCIRRGGKETRNMAEGIKSKIRNAKFKKLITG